MADGPGAPSVAIVNERMAAMAWPGQNPVGRHLDAWNRKGVEVIGVIADGQSGCPRTVGSNGLWRSTNGSPWGRGLEIRCLGPLPPIESAVRQIVKAAAPGYEVSHASSMELLRDNQISQERLLAFLSLLFGALGTTLALVGTR